MKLEKIQAALTERGLDAWLFCDFRHSDELAYQVLGLPSDLHATRRWFYLIPSKGEPCKIVHAIEPEHLASLPGKTLQYVKWQDLESILKNELSGFVQVAMQYSPRNHIPYLSKVDGGTLELIRSCGVEVISSGDLITQFQAVLTEEQLASHERAASLISVLIDDTFAEIGRLLSSSQPCTEFLIQEFMVQRYRETGLQSDCAPIVAVPPNNANPHYLPRRERSSEIRPGDVVLIDTWAKSGDEGIYFDVTWLAYVGSKPPSKVRTVFETVISARDAAFSYIEQQWSVGNVIRGCDIDDVARAVIEKAGFGPYIKHRTGHSIHTTTHGSGAHIDNLETHDDRSVLPGTLFSIEPGIYIDGEFGMRSEINVFMEASGPRSTGRPPQREIICIGE